jgi:hypothetical protein
MSGPQPPAQPFFAGDVQAAEHVCDHVLTRPEAHDWSLVLPACHAQVQPTDDDGLRQMALSVFHDPRGAQGQALLDAYVDVLLRAIDDALRLGFWWGQSQGHYHEWFGLGLDGIFVIWNAQVIKTGYLWRNVRWPPSGKPRSRMEEPLPRRNRAERLRSPPPNTERARYELFRDNHYGVSKKYAKAYDDAQGKISAGGDIFVDPLQSPRFNHWQRWVAARPGQMP